MLNDPVPRPLDDLARLGALDALKVLDTPPEQSFDDIVRLATRLCATPVALVSLVTSERQWFKARVGFPSCETDLDRSVCRYVLAEPDLLIVPDLTADPRTSANPLVTGEPRIRFYAGAPLRLSDGQVVGALCVIDTEPRPEGLTQEQGDDLRALGRQVAALLDMRRAINAREDAETALVTSEDRFRTILNTVEAAFAIVDVKFDDQDRPIDYKFIEANPAFERQAGVDLRGKWVTEFAPDLERFWFDTYGQVAKTGEPATFENYAEAFQRWFDVRAVRVGRPEDRRIAILFSDVTARKKAEEDLRASEAVARANVERVQLALAAGAIIGTWHWDIPSDRFTIDEAFAQSFGLDPELGHQGIPLAQIVATVHPDDQAALAEAIQRVITTGGAYAHQYRVRRTDDRYYWIEANGRVDMAPDGTARSFPGVLLDVEDRIAAQARRNALIEIGDQLRDASTIAEMTQRASAIVGRTLNASRAAYGVLTEDDGVDIQPDWTDGAKSITGHYRFADFGDLLREIPLGKALVIDDVFTDPRTSSNPQPMVDLEIGALVNVPVMDRRKAVAVLIAQDRKTRHWTQEELTFLRNVADRLEVGIGRLRAEADQRLLNEELSHRLKNTLAMVLSIAGQTLRKVTDREPIEAFEKRIHALSTAHDVLLQQTWSSAPMRRIVDSVMKSAHGLDRIDVAGPDIFLGPRATLSLSLLLHELATNAAKYGGMSVPDGRVSITWRLTGEGEDAVVQLDWVERGGPPPQAPGTSNRKGFGSRLIQMGLAGTGGVELRYPMLGFEATMRAPYQQLQLS